MRDMQQHGEGRVFWTWSREDIVEEFGIYRKKPTAKRAAFSELGRESARTSAPSAERTGTTNSLIFGPDSQAAKSVLSSHLYGRTNSPAASNTHALVALRPGHFTSFKQQKILPKLKYLYANYHLSKGRAIDHWLDPQGAIDEILSAQ